MAARAEEIIVYADGSCLGNPGPGGWGAVVIEHGKVARELSGSQPRTTNNRMELTAAIEALRALEPGARVLVRSDSEYLVKTMDGRYRRKANLDLWRKLDAEVGARRVRFEWVRGHAEDALNERADRLALAAAQEAAVGSASGPQRGALDPSSATDEAKLGATLAPLLGAGERIDRCEGCGELFVATGSRGSSRFCSRARCQLKARLKSAAR